MWNLFVNIPILAYFEWNSWSYIFKNHLIIPGKNVISIKGHLMAHLPFQRYEN